MRKTCCFFGHRKISKSTILENSLKTIIENLIIKFQVDTFLFGSKSQFNDLCYTLVYELKEKHSHIKLVYVRAEYPYINDDYKEYLLSRYDETYFPDSLFGAGAAVYVKRNYEMIDRSNFCIVYYDNNYALAKSGTKVAFDYAHKKGRAVINLFDMNIQ